jgi:type I restriction enzyme, R subunit
LNQNPEQLARDKIDHALLRSGWIVQSYKQKKIPPGLGVAIKEYPTYTGPADYFLFVKRKLFSVIEVKRPEEGVQLTVHEEQSTEYAAAKLKYLIIKSLSFVYEGTWNFSKFADYKDLRGDLNLMNAFYQFCFYISRTPNIRTNP